MSLENNQAATTPAMLTRLRNLMLDEETDAIIIGPSASFLQLLGRNANLTERMIALVVTHDSAYVVVPRLQEPLYTHFPVKKVVWDEHEDPTAAACKILAADGCRFVGVNREFWSGFLLRMQSMAPDLTFRSTQALDLMRAIKTPLEIEAMQRAATVSTRSGDAFSPITLY